MDDDLNNNLDNNDLELTVSSDVKVECRDCSIILYKPLSSRIVRCKDCRDAYYAIHRCEHGRYKYACRICHGSQICEHSKYKYACGDCGGSQVCEHGKYKYTCRGCRGSQICKHGKQKYRCLLCGGIKLCKHGRFPNKCKLCAWDNQNNQNNDKVENYLLMAQQSQSNSTLPLQPIIHPTSQTKQPIKQDPRLKYITINSLLN